MATMRTFVIGADGIVGTRTIGRPQYEIGDALYLDQARLDDPQLRPIHPDDLFAGRVCTPATRMIVWPLPRPAGAKPSRLRIWVSLPYEIRKNTR